MINEHLEELAALHALGLLDSAGLAELRAAAEGDPDVRRLIDEMDEAAALLAGAAPAVAPPPEIRRELLRQISARARPAPGRTFSFARLFPYATAAVLMVMVVWQQSRLVHWQHRVRAAQAENVVLRAHDDMVQFQLAGLEAKDAGYGSAKVMVAWDPKMNRGVVSIQNLPAPPPGRDYQLWVLDPHAPAPISAGLLKMTPGSHMFVAESVQTSGPGFAVSLEPAGGMPHPTGEILFAAAPTP